MKDFDLESLVEDDTFCIELNSNVWLMDDHRWAFYVWEKHRKKSDTHKFSLIHADYHWDSIYDFHESPEKEKELLNANLETLFDLIKEGAWVRYDSFIASAVVRGLLSEVHFYCKQDDDWDAGIDKSLLSRAGTTEFKHDSIESLAHQQHNQPIIFDLCLDLFNKSDMYYTGDLWSPRQIMNFLNAMKEKIIAAEVVTVSLSFGYSGTAADTRQLTKLVLPVLEEWRK